MYCDSTGSVFSFLAQLAEELLLALDELLDEEVDDADDDEEDDDDDAEAADARSRAFAAAAMLLGAPTAATRDTMVGETLEPLDCWVGAWLEAVPPVLELAAEKLEFWLRACTGRCDCCWLFRGWG